MKKLIVISGLILLSWNTNAQEVKDVKGNVIAYITNATISDKNKDVMFTFNPDGRIVDRHANTVGFLKGTNEGFEVQDKNRQVAVLMQYDGVVLDAAKQKVGSILRTTGPVIKNGNVIATIDVVEPMWAVCYFFLLKL